MTGNVALDVTLILTGAFVLITMVHILLAQCEIIEEREKGMNCGPNAAKYKTRRHPWGRDVLLILGMVLFFIWWAYF